MCGKLKNKKMRALYIEDELWERMREMTWEKRLENRSNMIRWVMRQILDGPGVQPHRLKTENRIA